MAGTSLDYFWQDKILTKYSIKYLDQTASLSINQSKARFMTNPQTKIDIR